MLLKIGKKTIWKLTLSKYYVLFETSQTANQYQNTCHYMANCLYLHDSYINKFDFINYAFAKLVVAWVYWNRSSETKHKTRVSKMSVNCLPFCLWPVFKYRVGELSCRRTVLSTSAIYEEIEEKINSMLLFFC